MLCLNFLQLEFQKKKKKKKKKNFLQLDYYDIFR